jgi:type I restriction enzyme M protein
MQDARWFFFDLGNTFISEERAWERAFRAITAGHSNRRRTQVGDFEALEVCFPTSVDEQRGLIRGLVDTRRQQRDSANRHRHEMIVFSAIIDGRGDEELPEVEGGSLSEDDDH